MVSEEADSIQNRGQWRGNANKPLNSTNADRSWIFISYSSYWNRRKSSLIFYEECCFLGYNASRFGERCFGGIIPGPRQHSKTWFRFWSEPMAKFMLLPSGLRVLEYVCFQTRGEVRILLHTSLVLDIYSRGQSLSNSQPGEVWHFRVIYSLRFQPPNTKQAGNHQKKGKIRGLAQFVYKCFHNSYVKFRMVRSFNWCLIWKDERGSDCGLTNLLFRH
jgi:hypothetical protein